ncbi:phosphopentomutase [Risungbinella massiliensis]|uniref:phosphopentomutase n=1 Tax=Risungbinella massiliensis TaxID=1329796 RepID=UPI0005CC6F1B|nr:phosphopentomutase [Risungbinella massiliensis]
MMKPFSKIFLVVLDSVGIGELPDAADYQDQGANTIGHIAEFRKGLKMPNMERLGLGKVIQAKGIQEVEQPIASYGRMMEISRGKDTTTGHWEFMGVHTKTAFKTYPEGFPAELIQRFEEQTGRKVIGNKPASGTEILDELGERHIQSGDLIVYTSADSVFQIAAHEEVVPLEELYRICEIARELTLDEKYSVVRVIARPFVGEPGNFTRTSNRRDYSVKPPHETVLNQLQDAGLDMIAIGKISDIYAGEGITRSIHTKDNQDGVDQLLKVGTEDFHGLCFLNLVDFDAKYGHRRDPEGYAKALEEWDERIPEVLDMIQEDDLLLIVADHGNDPTHHGTDHTREYVPLFAYTRRQTEGNSLGDRSTFADVGMTIAENFGVKGPAFGKSFLADLEG